MGRETFLLLIVRKGKIVHILTHLCRPLRSTFVVRETQSLGQQMLNATVGINGLTIILPSPALLTTLIEATLKKKPSIPFPLKLNGI